MLFARFLAENGLLMHPRGVAVTLEECAELARRGRRGGRLGAGRPLRRPDAARHLPRRRSRPSQVRFAPEGRQALEAILAGLPRGGLHRRRRPGLGLPVLAERRRRTRSTPASARSAAPTSPR